MTTTKQAIGALAVAALLVLAGCSSAVPGTTDVQSNDESTTAGDGGAGDGGAGGAQMTDVTFYVSDRPGAIEDFEHLNVTITKVGLHRAGGDDADDGNDGDDESATDEADSASANDTEDASMNADSVETTTVEAPNETTHTMTETESDSNETGTESDSSEMETESEEAETESTESDDESEESESDGKSDWVMHDVDNATVDLTKLQGANATAISNLSVPAGEYDKVFVYVSDVNATLTNGETVNVKLPSSKLQIKKDFALSANSSPDFVFDINVKKAGNSGKYILRPIVSESGTGDQVEIEKVDKNGKPENPGKSGEKGNEKDDDDGDETESEDDESTSLSASLDGDVRAGENVTVSVTNANGSVANATVAVNGDAIGETDADGTLTVTVPDTEELEITVTKGDAELELERKVKGGNGGGSGNGNNALTAPLALA